MKYYNSIKELENCIGKFVYFYYTNNGEKDGKVVYGWAKKITKIVRDKNFSDKKHQVKYHNVYGTDTLVFQDNQEYVRHVPTPYYKGRKEEITNAQQFARELTIIEKLLYRIYLKRQEAIEKGLIKIKPQDDN